MFRVKGLVLEGFGDSQLGSPWKAFGYVGLIEQLFCFFCQVLGIFERLQHITNGTGWVIPRCSNCPQRGLL